MASLIARHSVLSSVPSTQVDCASLQELMANYPCYAFVPNEDQSGARALFRGRWRFDQVAPYLSGVITTMIVNDERASGFKRFRLYGLQDECPVCLAEIEIYFARGDAKTSFWCQTEAETGALALAA